MQTVDVTMSTATDLRGNYGLLSLTGEGRFCDHKTFDPAATIMPVMPRRLFGAMSDRIGSVTITREISRLHVVVAHYVWNFVILKDD